MAALTRISRRAHIPGRAAGGGAGGAAVKLAPVHVRARVLAVLAVAAGRCPEALACIVLPLAVGSALFYRGARAVNANLLA
jgi:hypothetical protein